MNFIKGITYLAFVFVVCSCKKKPVDSEYILEREIKTAIIPTVTGSLDTIPVVIYSKAGKPDFNYDSLYGVIRCVRPENGETLNTKHGSIQTSQYSPLTYYGGSYLQFHPTGYKVYPNQLNPDLIVFEFYYKAKLYKVFSKTGFSNCILDTGIYKVLSASGQLPYEIKFNGSVINTDEITTCNGNQIPVTSATINLLACGSNANYSKPNSFKVFYSNYEHFTIEGKRFLIHKYAAINHQCRW